MRIKEAWLWGKTTISHDVVVVQVEWRLLSNPLLAILQFCPKAKGYCFYIASAIRKTILIIIFKGFHSTENDIFFMKSANSGHIHARRYWAKFENRTIYYVISNL